MTLDACPAGVIDHRPRDPRKATKIEVYASAVLTTYDFSRFKGAPWAGWLQKAHLLIARQDLYGNTAMTFSPWAAFLTAMLATFFIALLIGYPALRLRGHYLAMAPLGIGLIVRKMLVGSTITGSADGINGVPEWKLVPGLPVTGKSALRVQQKLVGHVQPTGRG